MKVVPKQNKITCNIKFRKGFCSRFIIRILIPWFMFLGCFNVSSAFYYASPFLIENFQLQEVRNNTNIVMHIGTLSPDCKYLNLNSIPNLEPIFRI